MAGGSSTQQPVQSTTTQLSPDQQSLLSAALPGLRQFAATVPARYPGATVAGFTPAQQQAQDLALGAVSGQQAAAKTAADVFTSLPSQIATSVPGLQPFVAQTQNYQTDPFSGLPQADAGLQSYIKASTDPLYKNLTEAVLPNVRSSAITAGGFGGSRQGIGEGLATQATAQQAGNTAANLAGAQYANNLAALQNRYATNINAENARYATNVQADQAREQLLLQAKQGDVNAQLQLLGLTPGVQQAQLAPALTAGGVGDTQQALNQAQLSAQIQGYNYDQLAPFLQSQELLSVLQGIPGGATVATGTVPQPNAGVQALGGALTGATIGSAFGPAGAGVGAAGGAVLPFLFR